MAEQEKPAQPTERRSRERIEADNGPPDPAMQEAGRKIMEDIERRQRMAEENKPA